MLSDEQHDFAREHRLELWAYSPLMSGAYDDPAKPISEVYDHPGSTRRLEVLDEVAAELEVSRGQAVLAWLVGHGIRPILGGSKLHQLDAALDAVTLDLGQEHRERLDAAR
ncbi:aldo/keto reductase [Microbacterium sp. NIBRBAC000506063]|uniref:aldo/keto reductase n=1 Tax=Microbacterium sp. NIBRBAC000506063 TaxID=2734618 RepID=UPI0021D3F3E8|nr:aldo/keto reductase [Microbacterium sp. NIBRBAC000506063]